MCMEWGFASDVFDDICDDREVENDEKMKYGD